MHRAFFFLAIAAAAFLAGATAARSADDAEPEAAVDQIEVLDEQDQWHAVEPEEVDERFAAPDARQLNEAQIDLRNRVRRCLAYYFHQAESARHRSPWGVMHWVIGFGVDTPLIADNRQVNAISWLCANAPCYGMRMLDHRNGSLRVRMGPGYQGHSGQFLCVLAQSRVKIDYPLIVGGQTLSVEDLVQMEQLTCRSGAELTFKLIGLSHYLDSDASWISADGQRWDIPRLLREELAQTIVGAPCGGTHRLTGFSYAVRKREASGRPVTGQWERARNYLDDFHEHAFKVQNADGSFSTDWFAKRSDWGDVNRKLNTTGHILEWLAFSLSDQQLREARVVRAVEFLTDLLWTYRGNQWPIGAKGHAIHALALYDERVFGGVPGQRAVQLARVESVQGTPDIEDRAGRTPSGDGRYSLIDCPPQDRASGTGNARSSRRRRRAR
jgi:hypothetical protein